MKNPDFLLRNVDCFYNNEKCQSIFYNNDEQRLPSRWCGNDELCVKNDDLCIKNDDLCIKNDEFYIKNDEFCSSCESSPGRRAVRCDFLLIYTVFRLFLVLFWCLMWVYFDVQGVALPPAAFSCVFPAISAALSGAGFEEPSAKEAVALHKPALSLLALHTAPDIHYPRVDMLRLLLQSVLVKGAGSLHNLASTLVVKLCLGLNTSELPGVAESLLSQHDHVRSACLSGLCESPVLAAHDVVSMDVVARLYCVRSDTDEETRAEAETAWNIYGYQLDSEACSHIVALLACSGVPFVRQSAARKNTRDLSIAGMYIHRLISACYFFRCHRAVHRRAA